MHHSRPWSRKDDANTKGPGAHSHPEDDVFYVIEGSVLVGESWHDASVGAFVLVPGGVTHDFGNRTSQRAGVLNFSSGVFEPMMPGIAKWFAEHPPGDARWSGSSLRVRRRAVAAEAAGMSVPVLETAPDHQLRLVDRKHGQRPPRT